jgi:hypothetical protein
MDSIQVLQDLYSRGKEGLGMIDGLTDDVLYAEPLPSIGWQIWRMGRSLDHNISGLIGADQVWIADSWHAKFGMEPDAKDFAPGFPPPNDIVRTFRAPSKQLLVDYFDTTYSIAQTYIAGLVPEDLDREIDHDRYATPPTIGIRLVSVGVSLSQSAGDIRYRLWIAT